MKRLYLLYLLSFVLVAGLAGASYPGKIIKSFPVPADRPTGLTWDGQFLWIADIGTNKIYRLDSESGVVNRTLDGPVNATINGLAWDGINLWCSDNGDTNKIYKLDAQLGTVMRSYELISGSPRGLAFDGHDIWYQDSGSNYLYRLDTLSGTVSQMHLAPAGGNRGLASAGNYFWSTDKDLDELYLLDSSNGKVIWVLRAPATYPYGLAFDGTFLWNTDYETDRVYKIDTRRPRDFLLYDTLQVDIRYVATLKNVGSSTMNLFTYLACPKNLPYQHLDDELKFTPAPDYFFKDKYKQCIAVFNDQLAPGNLKEYAYQVPVTLQSVNYFLHPDSVGELLDIPPDTLQLYTRNDEKYDISDPSIVAASAEAIAGETNLYWQVRNIHDYVMAHMEYERVGGWDAAPVILARGTGSCSEYTFLFIALCRAAGIPARYEGGGHLRDDLPYDDTVFHRWGQVYFPNLGWVPFDADADDKNFPANQARHFGARENDLFTTTLSGGGEPGLDWSYNVYNSSSGGERQREKLMQWLPYLTDITPPSPSIVSSWMVTANYPNPFNASTRIVYQLYRPQPVVISIFNGLGQRIRRIGLPIAESGSWVWNGQNEAGRVQSSGVYYYKIEAGKQVASGKMHFIK